MIMFNSVTGDWEFLGPDISTTSSSQILDITAGKNSRTGQSKAK